MSDEITAFPLAWPIGRPRAKYRERAPFSKRGSNGFERLTVAQGLDRLTGELRRLGARSIVVSTNLQVRSTDGLPRSGQGEPRDPGAAVYFQLEGRPHCLATDRWDRVADNIAAIAKHVEATRGQLRWGVGDVAQAFAGFRALPAAGAVRPWWEVLGFSSKPMSPVTLRDRWRELAERHHPDRGGNPGQMAEINAAYDEGRKELEL